MAAAEHTDADAAFASSDRVLDRAVADLDGGRLAVAEVHLARVDAQPADRRDRAIDHRLVRELLAHFVTLPPTTTLGMRSVGWASETGAPWPSLPHVPTEYPRSVPTMSISLISVGP